MTNTTGKNENLKKAANTEILEANKTPTKILHKTNKTNHNSKPNIQEKIHSLSPTNKYGRQGNSPSRELSNSNIKHNDKYERKIN